MKQDAIIRPEQVYEDNGKKYRITVYGGLHYIKGNKDAYFSITAQVDEWHTNSWSEGRWVDYASGCCHDEILKVHPDLAPVVALHLSDSQGAPMHALGNGWYWMRGACAKLPLGLDMKYAPQQSPEKCLDLFASHARISLAEAHGVRRDVEATAMSVGHYSRVYEGGANAPCKAYVFEYLEAQRPRWKREADEAVATFGLVRYGD